jgi:hypothetical protein
MREKKPNSMWQEIVVSFSALVAQSNGAAEDEQIVQC